MFGRNGESPLPIIAPATPGECFEMTVMAFRLAARIMSPVVLLSDGYLANSAEPWTIPDVHAMEPIQIGHPTSLGLNGTGFLPFARNAETMARPWALPGTPGLEHRIGGLSKEPGTGNVSYDPAHTQQMNDERRAKVASLADYLPEQDVYGPESGELLVLGWGGTFGALRQAVIQANAQGRAVAHAHIRYLNPFPRNLASVLSRYNRVLLPELNGGQLALLIQGRFLKQVIPLEKLQGQPFRISEIRAKIDEILG